MRVWCPLSWPSCLDANGRPCRAKPGTVTALQVVAKQALAPTATVVGRQTYDAKISASEFIGRLVWIMDVNESRTVTLVEVGIEEGVGKLMRDRAISAGYLSLFPPDRSRASEALKYRRELIFRAEWSSPERSGDHPNRIRLSDRLDPGFGAQ